MDRILFRIMQVGRECCRFLIRWPTNYHGIRLLLACCCSVPDTQRGHHPSVLGAPALTRTDDQTPALLSSATRSGHAIRWCRAKAGDCSLACRADSSASTSTSVRGRATAGHRRRLAGQVSKSPLFLSHRGHRLPRRACQAKKTLLRCPQSVPQRLDRTASRHLGGRRYLKYRPPSRYPRYRPPLGSCPATARWNAAELRPTNCAGRGGWRPAPLRQSIPCHAGESRVHLTVASLTPSPACSSSRGRRRARDETGSDLCMRLARMTLGTVL
jgi:hypothetical protein